MAALIGRAINLLSTKLARDPSGRIMTLVNFYTELTALDSHCQDHGPKFSHYDPSIGFSDTMYLSWVSYRQEFYGFIVSKIRFFPDFLLPLPLRTRYVQVLAKPIGT